jgi:hypothetical protein
MRVNARSATGGLLMLGILPMLAGLLACMPEYVPLGDPDRSKINPAMTGVWHVTGDIEPFVGQFLYFQPWDKHTWMVTNVTFEIDADALEAEGDKESPGYDLSNYEDVIRFLEEGDVDEDDVELSVIVYKGWVTKIRGHQFLMLEWRGLVNEVEDGVSYEPFVWWDFRVAALAGGRMELQLIDSDFEPLSEVPQTRRGWEKVVRKHADNPDLYYEDTSVLRRVESEDVETVSELIFYGFTRDNM